MTIQRKREDDLTSQEQQAKYNSARKNKPDFSWQVTAANWFLIGVGALIQDSIHAGGFAGGTDQFFGRLLGIAFGAAVPIAIIYLVTPVKKDFRFFRAITIAAWCILGLIFYPLLRNY